jgi:DNA-directed RNA polymerase subunit RPC12/RpoP
MNTYKYSCPSCGQHIEYTDGYCGKQMACPMCQQRILFPAIPPGALSPSFCVARPAEQQPVKKGKSNSIGIVRALRKFEHWNVVGQCLVPFVILAAALFVASTLRSKPPEHPVSAPAPAVDPRTWEKMTQLARMEVVLQERVRVLTEAYAKNQSADQHRAALQKQYGGRLDPITAKFADQQSAAAQKALEAAREAFENEMNKYQRLGGTIDFRRQVPN